MQFQYVYFALWSWSSNVLMILSLRTPSEKYTKETCVDLMILFYPTLYN